MQNPLWYVLAKVLATRPMYSLLWRLARGNPHQHIYSADGGSLYMGRWWLFNPLGKYPWLPSIRMHHIKRPDLDRHLHDHPWTFRTIVLKGGYWEQREGRSLRLLWAGDTASLPFGEFHRIAAVLPPQDGAWTLFITWRKRGSWGFKVEGEFVPHREYLK